MMKKNNNIYYILFFVAMVGFAIFAVVYILNSQNQKKSDWAEVDRILQSDDPTGNLAQALIDNPELMYARSELDQLGDPLLLSLAPLCALGTVNQINGIPGTANYLPDAAGPHQLVLLRPDGTSHDLTYTILSQWGMGSRDLENIDLVACVQKQAQQGLETCRYANGGASIKRLQNYVEIMVVEAATGRFVARTTITGSEPANCPSSVSKAEHQTYEGGEVSLSEIQEWLATFYE